MTFASLLGFSLLIAADGAGLAAQTGCELALVVSLPDGRPLAGAQVDVVESSGVGEGAGETDAHGGLCLPEDRAGDRIQVAAPRALGGRLFGLR